MKLMISQPMRDKTNEQIRKEREALVKQLEELGHEVVDTVFDDFQDKSNTPLHFLARSIKALANVDGLVCMQGWENARGCRIEEICAREYNKFILYLN